MIAIENRIGIIGRAEFMKYKTGIVVLATTMLCTMCMAVFTCNAKERYFKVNGDSYKNTVANDAYPVFVEGITTWNSENNSPSDYYGVRAELYRIIMLLKLQARNLRIKMLYVLENLQQHYAVEQSAVHI